MNAESFDLTDHKYINLETFRKSGVGVPTPVWFVRDGSQIFVRTPAASGKVKRLRHSALACIAPCTRTGALLSDWRAARARLVDDASTAERVDRLLRQKYGLLKTVTDFIGRLSGAQLATICIEVE